MKRTWIRQAATLTLLGLAGVAGAAEIEALKVAYAKGTFTVDAQMLLQAPVAAVRAALTDYEHLDQLSDAIAESHLLRQDADAATVFTRSRACAGWFCREIRKTERVTQTADTIVAEADPALSNVEHSVTRWHFIAVGDRTRVVWRVEVDPAFFIPPLIGPPLVKSAMQREGEAMAIGLERAARAIVARSEQAAPLAPSPGR